MTDLEKIEELKQKYEECHRFYQRAEWGSCEHGELRSAMAHCTYQIGLLRVKTDPVPDGQEFRPGTFVEVIRGHNMGPAMVQYTYSHAFKYTDGHSKVLNVKDYSLLCRYPDGKWSGVAWFEVDRLKEITDSKLIEQYKKEIDTGYPPPLSARLAVRN